MSSLKKQNLLLVTFGVLTIIFGSLFAFELVKGPKSITITSSTTFITTTTVLSNVTMTITETETVAHYITNQFFRTTSLTTPLTTSFPYDGHFSAKAGDILVSTWVVENGILLNMTCNPSFKVGDTFKFIIRMTNINNTARLSLLEMTGKFNLTIYNSKGSAVFWENAYYSSAPLRQNFRVGSNWTDSENQGWNTETNLPNKLGPGIPPVKPAPGDYILVAQGIYYNIDLNKHEQVKLFVPLTIR